MTTGLDPFVLEHAPGPIVELHPAVATVRHALRAAMATLRDIPDERLTSAWSWEGNAADVRYGFYRLLETIEAATSDVGRAVSGLPGTEARDAVGATTAARWDLHGVLAGLSAVDLDADPGNGEWTMRHTLGHIIGSQRGYAWGSAWWLSVRDQTSASGPKWPPDELFAGLPSDEEEARGSLAEVSERLDEVVDGTSSRYATLSADDMAVGGLWSGFPVTMAFRMWRWSSHIQEHTVQVEKTLDMLGRRPSEAQRLLRLITRAYGRLEQHAFGRPAAELESASEVAPKLAEVAPTLDRLAADIGAAADAGIPAPDW